MNKNKLILILSIFYSLLSCETKKIAKEVPKQKDIEEIILTSKVLKTMSIGGIHYYNDTLMGVYFAEPFSNDSARNNLRNKIKNIDKSKIITAHIQGKLIDTTTNIKYFDDFFEGKNLYFLYFRHYPNIANIPPKLLENKSLRRLHLNDLGKLKKIDLNQLNKLKILEIVELYSLSEIHIDKLTKLNELYISRCRSLNNLDLYNLKNLEKLDIYDVNLEDSVILPHNSKNLKQVFIYGAKNKNLEKIIGSLNFPSLTHLELRSCSIKDISHIISKIGKWNKLEVIILSGNPISDIQIKTLKKNNPKLTIIFDD